jgi:hypothetical protein
MWKPKSSQSSGSTKQAKKCKQISACQKTDGSCFLKLERRVNGGIHAMRDHNNISSVLQNTKKTA